MRLIDADALKEKRYRMHSEFLGTVSVVAVRDIDDAPTIDAVPVVRCKDCRFYAAYKGECFREGFIFTEDGSLYVGDDDFCSYGERKDNVDM